MDAKYRLRQNLYNQWQIDREKNCLWMEFCLRCRRVDPNSIRVTDVADKPLTLMPRPHFCDECDREIEAEAMLEHFCTKETRECYCAKVANRLEEKIKSEFFRTLSRPEAQKVLMKELEELTTELTRKFNREND